METALRSNKHPPSQGKRGGINAEPEPACGNDPLLCGLLDHCRVCHPRTRKQIEDERDLALAIALDLPRPPRLLTERQQRQALLWLCDLAKTVRRDPQFADEVRGIARFFLGGQA